jgi:phosphatidylinositol alpha-1,6-mannosyltransferase
VVAGNSGGAPDAVLDGVTGLVIDGRDPRAVGQSIETLLLSTDKAHQMGVAGRAWIIDQWQWKIWSKRFAELLRTTT